MAHRIIKERYELIEKIQSGGFGTTYLAIESDA